MAIRVLAAFALLGLVVWPASDAAMALSAQAGQANPSGVVASSGAEAWPQVSAERLLDPADGDWISYRRTYDGAGFSPLKQIDRTNIQRLEPIWSFAVRDNNRWVPTPIVWNGLMYVAEGSGRVLALDVASGRPVWEYERAYPDDISFSEAYRRHRGVSIFEDRIYFATADAHLVALDARTGALLWDVQTGDYRTGEGHAHPPLIADGKVFLGHAGGDFTARGAFRAFDARNGELLWTFFTAPGEGDPGYESWTPREVPPLGAAPWNTVTYDPDLRLVFFSTGQPAPWSSAVRGPGDALYANSILAVEAETGKLRWHYQLVPADDWDRAAFENMLLELVIDGEPRKVVVQTGKIGWGVVLDRETGQFLHAFRTAYDNVITGWTPAGRPIYNPATIPAPGDIDSGKVFEICPHIHGARNLQAPSFSPLTGLYYLGVNNSCMNAALTNPAFRPGRPYMGITYPATLAPGYDYVGEFVAFDPATGRRAWAFRPPGGAAMSASALATAGGIVFGGTSDRQFFALDTDNGRLLWETRLNGDISGAPITFEHAGHQFVAVGAGGRIAQTTSFASLTGTEIPQGPGMIWVFALPER
jgi:alcohol dehydrogenase (cytochrome c)